MTRDSLEVLRMKGACAEFGANTSAEFRRVAEATPFALRTLGLGAGVASLAARKGSEGKRLAAMIARWLLRDGPMRLGDGTPPEKDNPEGWIKALLAAIENASRNQYRVAQTEALAFAGWLKKLAQAFCPKDGD